MVYMKEFVKLIRMLYDNSSRNLNKCWVILATENLLTTKVTCVFLIKMAVCAFDRAQVAQSYVRKRRVPAEVRTMYCERCAR